MNISYQNMQNKTLNDNSQSIPEIVIYDQKLIDRNKNQQKNDKYLRMGHQTHKSQHAKNGRVNQSESNFEDMSQQSKNENLNSISIHNN
jgi:hypothetical protein